MAQTNMSISWSVWIAGTFMEPMAQTSMNASAPILCAEEEPPGWSGSKYRMIILPHKLISEEFLDIPDGHVSPYKAVVLLARETHESRVLIAP